MHLLSVRINGLSSFGYSVAQFVITVICFERLATFSAIIPLHMKNRILPFTGCYRNLCFTSWASNHNIPHDLIIRFLSYLAYTSACSGTHLITPRVNSACAQTRQCISNSFWLNALSPSLPLSGLVSSTTSGERCHLDLQVSPVLLQRFREFPLG